MKTVQPNGYTILELMIVITVSASMFVMVAVAFGGRQQQIQFTQAVRDLDARILDIVNDVSTGYYDNSGTIDCSVAAGPTERPKPNGTSVVAATADKQGSSDNCVFIGKAIQFAPLTSDTATGTLQPDVINVYNIIGRRSNNGTVDNLQEARPKAVAPDAFPDVMNLDSQVSKIPLLWGMKVTDIYDNNTVVAPKPYGTIGFFTSFSKAFYTPTGDINISNNQSIRYGAIPATFLGQSPYDAVSKINKITDDASLPVSGDNYIDTTSNTIVSGVRQRAVIICLKSADDKRRAAIVIGADGTTSTQIQFDNYDGTKCVS